MRRCNQSLECSRSVLKGVYHLNERGWQPGCSRRMFGGVHMRDKLPHRWGGLAARYSKNRVAIRLLDPITGNALEFGKDERYESWLLHRFDPAVATIHVDGDSLVRAIDGRTNSCQVHLDIRYASGARVLEYVTKGLVCSSKRRDLSSLAAANGATGVIRQLDEIRADLWLIANLRQLRHTMQLRQSARYDEELERRIREIGRTTRRDFLSGNPRKRVLCRRVPRLQALRRDHHSGPEGRYVW